MKLFITNKILDELDMKTYSRYVSWCPGIHSTIFFEKSGTEHYRLLSYLSKHLPKASTIVDIGTFYGASALAFSMNTDVHIITYDIVDNITPDNRIRNEHVDTIYDIENIQSRIKDCTEDISVLSSARIIFLDVNPHDGIKELDLLNKIRQSGFRGILLVDDIHLNKEMNAFWNSIPERKKDVTKYGHWSGTGIVYFSEEDEIYLM